MLNVIRERIHRACERAGRDPATVTLVAVTKGHGTQEIQDAVLRHQHRVLGESRVQEWRDKHEALPDVEWHFIGNLQTNKVKYCLPFHTIHSLNSARLADALEGHGAKKDHVFKVMVEVNVAGEESKQGAGLSEAADLVRYAQSLAHVQVRGLMTIAPYGEDPEAARPIFRKLRELRDRLGLDELSMGMSGDFEVAIEEGATFIRVGSALFKTSTHSKGRSDDAIKGNHEA
jgi:pyridoxal phosphate enzyme (YggS family)